MIQQQDMRQGEQSECRSLPPMPPPVMLLFMGESRVDRGLTEILFRQWNLFRCGLQTEKPEEDLFAGYLLPAGGGMVLARAWEP